MAPLRRSAGKSTEENIAKIVHEIREKADRARSINRRQALRLISVAAVSALAAACVNASSPKEPTQQDPFGGASATPTEPGMAGENGAGNEQTATPDTKPTLTVSPQVKYNPEVYETSETLPPATNPPKYDVNSQAEIVSDENTTGELKLTQLLRVYKRDNGLEGQEVYFESREDYESAMAETQAAHPELKFEFVKAADGSMLTVMHEINDQGTWIYYGFNEEGALAFPQPDIGVNSRLDKILIPYKLKHKFLKGEDGNWYLFGVNDEGKAFTWFTTYGATLDNVDSQWIEVKNGKSTKQWDGEKGVEVEKVYERWDDPAIIDEIHADIAATPGIRGRLKQTAHDEQIQLASSHPEWSNGETMAAVTVHSVPVRLETFRANEWEQGDEVYVYTMYVAVPTDKPTTDGRDYVIMPLFMGGYSDHYYGQEQPSPSGTVGSIRITNGINSRFMWDDKVDKLSERIVHEKYLQTLLEQRIAIGVLVPGTGNSLDLDWLSKAALEWNGGPGQRIAVMRNMTWFLERYLSEPESQEYLKEISAQGPYYWREMSEEDRSKAWSKLKYGVLCDSLVPMGK